jgi:hypothetical protein
MLDAEQDSPVDRDAITGDGEAVGSPEGPLNVNAAAFADLSFNLGGDLQKGHEQHRLRGRTMVVGAPLLPMCLMVAHTVTAGNPSYEKTPRVTGGGWDQAATCRFDLQTGAMLYLPKG